MHDLEDDELVLVKQTLKLTNTVTAVIVGKRFSDSIAPRGVAVWLLLSNIFVHFHIQGCKFHFYRNISTCKL
jgi:hypothetical protein